MPCAPASRHTVAARTTSGAAPPRELRSTAILLTLTLRTVIGVPPDELAAVAHRRFDRGVGPAPGFGLFAQSPQLLRLPHKRLVARSEELRAGKVGGS